MAYKKRDDVRTTGVNLRGGTWAEFGNELRFARGRAGLSQLGLGNHVGISQSDVSRYERHELVPTTSHEEALWRFIDRWPASLAGASVAAQAVTPAPAALPRKLVLLIGNPPQQFGAAFTAKLVEAGTDVLPRGWEECPEELPSCCDGVIIVVTHSSHTLSSRGVTIARAAGKPYAMVSHQWSKAFPVLLQMGLIRGDVTAEAARATGESELAPDGWLPRHEVESRLGCRIGEAADQYGVHLGRSTGFRMRAEDRFDVQHWPEEYVEGLLRLRAAQQAETIPVTAALPTQAVVPEVVLACIAEDGTITIPESAMVAAEPPELPSAQQSVAMPDLIWPTAEEEERLMRVHSTLRTLKKNAWGALAARVKAYEHVTETTKVLNDALEAATEAASAESLAWRAFNTDLLTLQLREEIEMLKLRTEMAELDTADAKTSEAKVQAKLTAVLGALQG